eukprot:SAG11_NODE_8701_length_986_cov_1.047351_1_plen_225_part_00
MVGKSQTKPSNAAVKAAAAAKQRDAQTREQLRRSWQLVHAAAPLSVELATLYGYQLHCRAKKEGIPLAEGVGQRFCQRCSALLVPGVNCRVRVRRLRKPREGNAVRCRSGGAEVAAARVRNRVRTTCGVCGHVSSSDGTTVRPPAAAASGSAATNPSQPHRAGSTSSWAPPSPSDPPTARRSRKSDAKRRRKSMFQIDTAPSANRHRANREGRSFLYDLDCGGL